MVYGASVRMFGEHKMTALLFRRNVFQTQRGLATSFVLYWNGKPGKDIIQ